MRNQIIHGDALEVLKILPDESVNCCVTSPPYFGLRDYGVAGQIGKEKTPEEYIARLVEVFREVRRVLRNDGTLWVNIGDSYSGSGKGASNYPLSKAESKQKTNKGSCLSPLRKITPDNISPKNLIGIPWLLAFALRTDGWYLRQDIIWSKPNPMPESVTDRCTKAHEYIFLLSKSAKYYFDNETIKEPAMSTSLKHFTDGGKDKQRGHGRRHARFNGRYAERLATEGVPTTRNKRDVWTVATQPFIGSHFATFPPELIRPCIRAGCPAGGIVLDPFLGSGTTATVALEEGRGYLGIEINGEYITKIAEPRIAATERVGSLFNDTGRGYDACPLE